MKHLLILSLCLCVIATCGAACSKTKATTASSASSSPPAAESRTESAPSAKVARIVFIDLENCCKCTRQRTDDSWAALQTVIKEGSPAIPVERIHMDSDPEKAAPYRDQRSIMVVPAIYFLDEDGNLSEMIQGETTADNIRTALGIGKN